MIDNIYENYKAEDIIEVLIEYIKQGYSIEELASKIGIEEDRLFYARNRYVKKNGWFSQEEMKEINKLKKKRREDDHFAEEWEKIIQKRKESSSSEENLSFLKGNNENLEKQIEEIKLRWEKESIMGEEIKEKLAQKDLETRKKENSIIIQKKDDDKIEVSDYKKINKINIKKYIKKLEADPYIQQEETEEEKKLKEEKEFRKMIAEDLSDIGKRISGESKDLTEEEKEFKKMINEEFADLKAKKLKEMQDDVEKQQKLQKLERQAYERRKIQKLVEDYKKTNIESEELKRKKEELKKIHEVEEAKRKEKKREEKIKKEKEEIDQLKEYVEKGYSFNKIADKMFCSPTRVRALVEKAKEKNEWYSDKEIIEFKNKKVLENKHKVVEKHNEINIKKNDKEELIKECEIEYRNARKKAIFEDEKEIDGKKNVSLEGRKDFSKVLIKMQKLNLNISEDDIELLLNTIYLHPDFADKGMLKFLIIDSNKKDGLRGAKKRASELCELLKKSSKYFNQILEYKEEVNKLELEIAIKKLKAENRTLNEISKILRISPIEIINISNRKKSDLFEDLEK